MKKLGFVLLLNGIIGMLYALDLQSYQFIDLILSLDKPRAPLVFDNAVVFTANGAHHRTVGIAFAHEDFAKIYRFKKVMSPIDQTEPFNEKAKKPPQTLRDSGLLFYAYEVPPTLERLEYRLIVDGLWNTDPANPTRRTDFATGLELSVAPVPPPATRPAAAVPGDALNLHYFATPGDYVTVAGDFNGWDPFMYQLTEVKPGLYEFKLPLPAGRYRYALYHNGAHVLDPHNVNKEYAPGGKVVNIVTITE